MTNQHFVPDESALIRTLKAIPGVRVAVPENEPRAAWRQPKKIPSKQWYVVERDDYKVYIRALESAGRIGDYLQLWDEYEMDTPTKMSNFFLRYVVSLALHSIEPLEGKNGSSDSSTSRKTRRGVVD